MASGQWRDSGRGRATGRTGVGPGASGGEAALARGLQGGRLGPQAHGDSVRALQGGTGSSVCASGPLPLLQL